MSFCYEKFREWKIDPELCGRYDIDAITWNSNGICFTLISDKKCEDKEAINVTWASCDVVAYNITDETYRADCWDWDFDNKGRMFVSDNSEYIEKYRQKSPLFPENTLHFAIVGANFIADILAKNYPAIDIVK